MIDTFGTIVTAARRKLGMTQKALATKLKKEDGTGISTTYLNDIEHDRRRPSEPMITQFARLLGLEADYLYHLLGLVPTDLQSRKVGRDRVLSAYKAFRRELDR